MNKVSDDISKDLKDQPKFTSDIGEKDQDHHSFDLGEQTTLKKIQHFLHGNPTIVPVIILILSVIAFGFIAGGKFFSAFNLSCHFGAGERMTTFQKLKLCLGRAGRRSKFDADILKGATAQDGQFGEFTR